MTKHEQLIERYEDSAFALVMDNIAVAEGEKYLNLNQQLKKDPMAEVPESVNRRSEKTINRAFRKAKAISAAKTSCKMINRVAVAFLIVSLTFATAFSASADFRASTYRFVMKVFDDHFEYSYEDAAGFNYEVKSYTAFKLGWVPEGYDLINQFCDDISYQVIYQDKQGNVLSAWLMSLSSFGQVSADAENTIISHEIINSYDVTVFYNECLQAVIQIPESTQVVHIIVSSDDFPCEALIQAIENINLY